MAAPLAGGRHSILRALLPIEGDDFPAHSRPLVTPNADFFIRNHFQSPRVDADSWSLAIEGMVAKPTKISYPDLLLMTARKSPVTLECAGNPSGGPGVGTAVWSGVPLSELLKVAGVQPGAATVVFHGADSGEGEGAPPGTHYARAIPLDKAMDPHTMLVYEMNGAPLPAEHGFPLRALVGGWYGMDSVKWLTRIELLQKGFSGFFQEREYVALKTNGERRLVTSMQVNSKFLRPSDGEEIRGKTYRVEGLAWAGERKVAKVELGIDGGGWHTAALASAAEGLVWTPWSLEWQVPQAGVHTLRVRATDEDGRTQPDARDPDRKDIYELNSCNQVRVSAKP